MTREWAPGSTRWSEVWFQALIGGFSAMLVLVVILSPLGTAAVLYVIAQEFIDQKATMTASFAFAFQRFFSLLFLSLIFSLVVFVGTCCLCVVPGILLAFAFPLVAQVVVMEGIGPFEVFGRLRLLTRGFRGRLFGLLVILLVIQGAGFMVDGVLQPVLPSFVPHFTSEWAVEFELYSYFNHVVHTIVGFVATTLTQAYATICLSLFYFDLRIRKEGYDLELAAKQQRGGTS